MFTVLNHLSPLVTRHPVAARDLYCPVRLVSHTLTLPYSRLAQSHEPVPIILTIINSILLTRIICPFPAILELSLRMRTRSRSMRKVGSFDREMKRAWFTFDEIIKSSSRNDPDERRCTRAKYVSSRNGTMEEA